MSDRHVFAIFGHNAGSSYRKYASDMITHKIRPHSAGGYAAHAMFSMMASILFLPSILIPATTSGVLFFRLICRLAWLKYTLNSGRDGVCFF